MHLIEEFYDLLDEAHSAAGTLENYNPADARWVREVHLYLLDLNSTASSRLISFVVENSEALKKEIGV